jgi:hypothetical protein
MGLAPINHILKQTNKMLYIYELVTNKSQHYVTTNRITNGSHNPTKRCHEGQAVTAFLWFLFACYAASTAFSLLGGSSSGGSPGIRRGPAPVMTHV